jgi:ribosomal protein L7/L12
MDDRTGIGGDIVAIAQAGQKAEAIKMYRQRTGASLQQAREAIELALIRGY